MSTPALPILYSFRRCPYAMRARLALALAGQTCVLREVVLRNKPEALLEASPKGTVPVLVLPDGGVIDESLDIMHWALAASSLPVALCAHSADAQAALIQACDHTFKPLLDRYKYPNRYKLDSGVAARDSAAQWLSGLDQRLQQQAYLFGAQALLADWAIAPFVRQYAHTDIDWFTAQTWPNLQRWFNTFLQSELFARCMDKYPPWQAGDPPTYFPPSLNQAMSG